MIDREKVIKGLECCAGQCNYHGCPYKDPCENANGVKQIMLDAIAMLKEQEGYVSVPFSWLVKFCTHIDFVEPLTDAEREAAWRKKLRQQFNINAPEKAVKWE